MNQNVKRCGGRKLRKQGRSNNVSTVEARCAQQVFARVREIFPKKW
jgi:hypothetical protein